VDRNQSIPPEFSVPDGQYRGLQVDIFELEIARLEQA
jgi:hypothetical protein